MTTTATLPAPPAGQSRDLKPPAAAEIAAEKALMPVPQVPDEDGFIAPASPLARLPVELDVAVPVRDFRVSSLLAMKPGQVIETQWALGEDMPLAAGHVQLAWSEFEVIDTILAVRVTRLA